MSPAAADSLAAFLAGNSDFSGDDGEGADYPPVVPNTAGVLFEEAFPGMPLSDAVLEVVCRAAALTGRLSGENRAPGGTVTEEDARDLADEASMFVTKYVAALLGRMNTRKFHRLANHLCAALMDHGNLAGGDTSVNEGLHKKCKRMYARTNKRVDTYTLQMLRACETLSHVLDEAAKEQEVVEREARETRGEGSAPPVASKDETEVPPMEWTGGELRLPFDGDEDSSGDEADTGRLPARTQRLRGLRVCVRDLADSSKHGMSSRLGALLGVPDGEAHVLRPPLVKLPPPPHPTTGPPSPPTTATQESPKR